MWLALCVCVACAAGLHKTKLVIEEQETAGLLLWLRAYTDLNTPGSYSQLCVLGRFLGSIHRDSSGNQAARLQRDFELLQKAVKEKDHSFTQLNPWNGSLPCRLLHGGEIVQAVTTRIPSEL